MLCVVKSEAQPVYTLPQERTDAQSQSEGDGLWWGYFNDDYTSITGQGIGVGLTYPLSYSCAIKLERTNPEILGKRIKAIKFALLSLNNIKDVKVWMSTILPLTADDSDICCENIANTSLVSIEEHEKINEIVFAKPYQFGASDIYIGYSFTVTSEDAGVNTYPVAVAGTETSENAFFIDWGRGWTDLHGKDQGNLAIMLLLDDDGTFLPGDANYDVKVNVGDVAATIEYIMNGTVNPFNKEMADVDNNGDINIVDVASIVDIILGKYGQQENVGNNTGNEDLCVVTNSDEADVSLVTDNTYNGFQMDVILTKGTELKSLQLSDEIKTTHSFKCSRIADGRYRIIVYSASGTPISHNTDKLFKIISDDSDVRLDNVIFATSGLEERHFEHINYTDAAGIDNVEKITKNGCIYDINGVKLSTDDILRKGIYIINGRKTVVR